MREGASQRSTVFIESRLAAELQCSADDGVMSTGRLAALRAKRVSIILATAGCLLGTACQPLDAELPPPRGVHLVCQPPERSPWPVLRMAPPSGSSCGLRDLECDERRPLVVRVDESGHVTDAYIRGMRSVGLDACVLKEVRANDWRFGPARDCYGDPIAGEYVSEMGIICGNVALKVASGRTKG